MKPTEKQIKFAQYLAMRMNEELPEDTRYGSSGMPKRKKERSMNEHTER